jgi:hypothetical protein
MVARDSRGDVQSRSLQARDLRHIRTRSAAGGDDLATGAVELGFRILPPSVPSPRLRNPPDPLDPPVRSVGHFDYGPGQGHSLRERGLERHDSCGQSSRRPASSPLFLSCSGFARLRPLSSHSTAPLLNPRPARLHAGLASRVNQSARHIAGMACRVGSASMRCRWCRGRDFDRDGGRDLAAVGVVRDAG